MKQSQKNFRSQIVALNQRNNLSGNGSQYGDIYLLWKFHTAKVMRPVFPMTSIESGKEQELKPDIYYKIAKSGYGPD